MIKYNSGALWNVTLLDTIIVKVSPPSPDAREFGDRMMCVGGVRPSFLNVLTNPFTVEWYTSLFAVSPFSSQAPGVSFDPLGGSNPLPGSYVFYVSQSNITSCESPRKKITITVYNNPVVNAGVDTSVCRGYGIALNATGADSYAWTPSDLLSNANTSSPIASPFQTTVFTVTGTAFGCSSTDVVTVSLDSTRVCELIIYNGITPNGDGHNDYWHIDGIISDADNNVIIFNRWGDKIWETAGYNNQSKRWEGLGTDGRLLPDGTYYYLINHSSKPYKGWLELTK